MNERRIKSNALKLTTTNDSTDWEAEMIPNQIPVNNPFLAAIIIANPAINSKTAVPPKVPPRSLESFKSQNTAVTTLSSDHIKSVDLTLDDNKSIDLTLDNIESVDLTLDDDPEKFLKNFTLNETGNFIVKAKLPLALQKESPETFFQSFVKPVQKADDDVIEIQPVKSKKRVRFCMESENPPALAQTILDKEFISVMQTIELDLESDDSEKYVMVNENFFDPTKDPMPGLDKNDPILWSGFPKFCMMGRKIMDNNYTSSCHIELERQGQFKILVAEVCS